jgi:hypothetical protein
MLVSVLLLAIGAMDTQPSLTFFISNLPTLTGAIIGVAIGSWILALGLLEQNDVANETPARCSIR